MLKKIVFTVIALLPFCLGLEAGVMDKVHNVFSKEPPPPPPTIRVLLVHDQPGVMLEVKGKYQIYDPRTGNHLSTSYSGKRRFIQAVSDGVKWGEEFPGIYQLKVIPDDPQTTTLVNGVEYLGPVYVYDVGGTLSVVNQVSIEDYLSSVLPQKYPEALPQEVLAALAITARTNTCYQAQNGKTPFWDVDASNVDYHGYALTNRPKDKEMLKAIKETRYMVLSRVGKNEWVQTPFAVEWRPGPGGKIIPGTLYSTITLEQAVQMAKKGSHAAQILAKAFPETSIQLMHHAP